MQLPWGIVTMKSTFRLACCLGLASLSSLASAALKDAWEHADLFRDQGDYLKLSGRLHADAIWFDANQGDYDDVRWRRFRFGFKGQYGQIIAALEADLDFNADSSEHYQGLTDAYLAWKRSKHQQFIVLKHSAPFTLDGATSSKKLLTPERNNLTNNLWFTAEYFNGVSVKGNNDQGWKYFAGYFSADDHEEISFSDGGHFALLSLAKSIENFGSWDRALFRVDLVDNEEDPDSNTRDMAQVLSFSSQLTKGKISLATDLGYGNGYLGQADILGVVFMPSYAQSETISWAARYTYLDSNGDNGLRLNRYESSVVNGRGDQYQELFAGINYFVNGHKLKLQLGLQYTDMNDDANDGGSYSGFGLTGALRVYW
jgi:phosphate-selective porin OprO/OprP